MLCSVPLKARLDVKVLLSTGQTGQPEKDRHRRLGGCLWRNVRREFGFTLQLFAEEAVHILQAAEALDTADQL